MVIASTEIRPDPSKLEAVAKMPRPTNVEELRAFLGLSDYLIRQVVENYSIIIAFPVTDILRSINVRDKARLENVYSLDRRTENVEYRNE